MLTRAIIIDGDKNISEQNIQIMVEHNATIKLSCISLTYLFAIINRLLVTYNSKWYWDITTCLLFLLTGYVTGTMRPLSVTTVLVLFINLVISNTTLLGDIYSNIYSKIKMSKWYWDGIFVLSLLLIGYITGTLSSLLLTVASIVGFVIGIFVILFITSAW
uniref:Uncharacterized protein n=1 Tax=Mimivirus LCMiAC01 TaxID=2506608 RepID=A0A481Z0V2_9VIRU|nr:MAG: hypothetical protein LCMiAC01_03750 [Mimivirus LCMiAC01]